jgi:hypothetical protein
MLENPTKKHFVSGDKTHAKRTRENRPQPPMKWSLTPEVAADTMPLTL